MSQNLKSAFVLAFVCLFAIAPAFEVAQADSGGVLRRLAVNKRGFVASDEISVIARALAPDVANPFVNGGVVIYDKNIKIPEGINVLFITISATGDAHGGARILLGCLVDGEACSPSKIPNGAPDGWVTLQRHKNYNLNYAPGATPFVGDGFGTASDLHDNSIHYTWCKTINKKKNGDDDDGVIHNIKIKMASQHVEDVSDIEGQVSIEAVHFYIDGAKMRKKNACTVDNTPIPAPF